MTCRWDTERIDQLDTTAWVAIAGIGGTLTGTLLAPLLAEKSRRRSVRTEQLRERRLTIYADLLNATARLADNASNWSAIPLADLKETDENELNRLISGVRVVASDNLYQRFNDPVRQTYEFNRQLFHARSYHSRIREEGTVDDAQAIALRVSLGGIANKMVTLHKQLEATIRTEIGR